MNYKELVGFDYAQAILELSHRMTYEKIATALGYKNKTCIYQILHGTKPSHPRGEALWALYTDTFGKKPPHSEVQKKGVTKQTEASV